MVVRELDDEVVATGQCVPFYWPELADAQAGSEGSLDWAETLPDGGWDTILARGVLQAKARRGDTPTPETASLTEDQRRDEIVAWSKCAPNALSGLLVNVAEEFKGNKIADLLLLNFKTLARTHNLQAVVVPLRPTNKEDYPGVSMEHYLTWTHGKPHQPGFKWALDEDMVNHQPLPFDPWLRKHIRMGAKAIKLAPTSSTVEAAPATWQKWLGAQAISDSSVDQDGQEQVTGEKLDGFQIDGRPLRWDPVRKLVCYTETDVWVLHSL